MNELCCNHDGDNPHDIIAEEIGSGQLRYFEHIIKRYQQLDRTYHNRAVSRGVVGAAYWKPGKGRRRRGAPISAVSRRGDDDDIAEISDGFSRVVRPTKTGAKDERHGGEPQQVPDTFYFSCSGSKG